MARDTRPISWIKAARKDFEDFPEGARLDILRALTIEGDIRMSNEDFELVRGSGNVFRDFDRPNADAEQLRSILAAQIIKTLDERELTVRAAENLTGIAATDFSRIRHAKLERFTIDRLITILNRLNRQVEVTVVVRALSNLPQLAPVTP